MTDELALLPARSLGLAEYAALFNAAYEGYLIPFHIDENTVAAMREAFDLDADASLIAFRDGEGCGARQSRYSWGGRLDRRRR